MRKIRAFDTGIRSGPWTQNKCTNLTPYSPFNSQAERIIREHWQELHNDGALFYHADQPKIGFVQPLTIDSIKSVVEAIPRGFTRGLNGIFICPGSRKQQNYSDFVFGCYDNLNHVIFLFPFPETMCFYYKTKPKPSVCYEYERHGAAWRQEQGCWKLEFTLEALRSFYLRDVLVHEIGHHVDNMSLSRSRSYSQKERFAEWFAVEFGMRSASQGLSKFGQVMAMFISGK